MPSTAWELRLRALTLFITSEGREPSPLASTPGERRLALWLQEQRHAVRTGHMTEPRTDALRDAGVLDPEDTAVPLGAIWLKVASISEFIKDEGRVPSLQSASSVGEKRLAAWLGSQLTNTSVSSDVTTVLRQILATAASRPEHALAAAV